MALQGSGEITINDIYTELSGNALMPSDTTLENCSNGTVAIINTDSPSVPNTTPPYSLESWYGYDHSYSATATKILELDLENVTTYNGSGSTLTDLSASGNNMTMYTSYTHSTDNPTRITFNSTTGYAQVSTTTADFEFQPTDAFAITVSFQVPPSSAGSWAIVANMNGSSPFDGWDVIFTPSLSKITFQIIDTWTSDAMEINWTYDFNANAGQNILLAMVYDGSSPTSAAGNLAAVDMYIDGALYTTGKSDGGYTLNDSTISYSATQELRLSSRWVSGSATLSQPYPINYVSIYNGEPTSGDMSTLFNTIKGRFVPNTSFTISDTTPDITQDVVFTSTSSSPKGAITTYEWKISGVQNTDWQLQAGSLTGSTCTIRFLNASTNYIVNLRVDNNYGQETTAFLNNITTNANGFAPSAAFTISFPGTTCRTDKVVTLTDTSTGGTDRAWEITGGTYTVLAAGALGTYLTGQGGDSVITVTLDNPDKDYTINLKAYNTNGTSVDGDAVFVTAYLLEAYPALAKQAFSVYKLNADLTQCVRVRRVDSGAQTDIGFDDNGLISYTEFLTFASGSACEVVTWYDQSGNGWNVTADTSFAPQIWDGTNLTKDPSENVAVKFTAASSERMTGATGAGTMGLSGSQDRTDYLVACETVVPYTTSVNIAGTCPVGYGNGYLWRATQEPAVRVYGGNILWADATNNLAKTSVQLGVYKLNGTDVTNTTFYYNGSNTAQAVASSSARTMAIPTTAYTRMGNDYNGTNYLTGYIAEYIVYATAHDDTTRGQIEDRILARYLGI